MHVNGKIRDLYIYIHIFFFVFEKLLYFSSLGVIPGCMVVEKEKNNTWCMLIAW